MGKVEGVEVGSIDVAVFGWWVCSYVVIDSREGYWLSWNGKAEHEPETLISYTCLAIG